MSTSLSINPADLSSASQQLVSLGRQCSQGKLNSSDGFGESATTASTIERLFTDALEACGESFKGIASSIDTAIEAFQATDSSGQSDFNEIEQHSGAATPSSPTPASPSSLPSGPR